MKLRSDAEWFIKSLDNPINHKLFFDLKPKQFVLLDKNNWDWAEKSDLLFFLYKIHQPIVGSKITCDKDTVCETSVGSIYYLTSLSNHFGYIFSMTKGDYHIGTNMIKIQKNPKRIKEYNSVRLLWSDNNITMYGHAKSASLIVNHLNYRTDRTGFYGIKTKGKDNDI